MDAEAETRHDLANFLGDETHEVDDIFRSPGELLPELRVLRGHADRAGVEMADTHHHATHRYQWSRREAKFLCSEKRANDDVPAGLQLSVHFDDNSAPKVIEKQRLLCLGQAKLPRCPGMLDAG